MILTTNIINIASSCREMFGVMDRVFDFELENDGSYPTVVVFFDQLICFHGSRRII